MSFTCTPITPYLSYTIPPFSRFDVPATGRAPFGPDDVVPIDLPVDAEVKIVGRMRGAGDGRGDGGGGGGGGGGGDGEILAELKAQFEAKYERCSANSPNAGRRLCGCGAHVPHMITFDHLLATGIWRGHDIAAVSGGKEAIARYMVRQYGKEVFTQKQREEAGGSCKTWHRGWYGYQPKVPDPVAAGGGERPRPTMWT